MSLQINFGVPSSGRQEKESRGIIILTRQRTQTRRKKKKKRKGEVNQIEIPLSRRTQYTDSHTRLRLRTKVECPDYQKQKEMLKQGFFGKRKVCGHGQCFHCFLSFLASIHYHMDWIHYKHQTFNNIFGPNICASFESAREPAFAFLVKSDHYIVV